MAGEVTAAAIKTVSELSGGYILGIEGSGTDPVRRIPTEELAQAIVKAGSALQADDIGSAAALSVEEVDARITAQLGDIAAALALLRGPQ